MQLAMKLLSLMLSTDCAFNLLLNFIVAKRRSKIREPKKLDRSVGVTS